MGKRKYALKTDVDLAFNPSQPRDRKGRWTDSAAGLLSTAGGFTKDVMGKDITSGYAVGVKPPSGQRDWMTKYGVSGKDLDAFVDEHSETLREPGLAVGGWRDPETGKDVIDVSRVTGSKRKAAKLAYEGKQHSVYDLDSGEEIETPDLLARALASQPEGEAFEYGDLTVMRSKAKKGGYLDHVTGDYIETGGGDVFKVTQKKRDRQGNLKTNSRGEVKSGLTKTFGNTVTGGGVPGSTEVGVTASNSLSAWMMRNQGKAVPMGLDEKTAAAIKTDEGSYRSKLARSLEGNPATWQREETARLNAETEQMRNSLGLDPLVTGGYSIKRKKKAKGLLDRFRTASLSNEEEPSLSTLTPTFGGEFDLSVENGKIAFWKQILPKKAIHYTAKDGSRQTLNFDDAYLTDLASHKAVDEIGFLLADKDNAHTMDPERWRGKVAELAVRDDGLYGKIVFPSLDAAKAVIENPSLGVSARIREGVQKDDGSTVPRGIIHVLGTLDPQVSGMSPWTPTDLSAEHDEVLDLSDLIYEEIDMTTEPKALADYTDADIEAMTDEELTEFLAEHAPGFSDYAETDEEHEDESTLVGAGADMSTKTAETGDLELANAAVATANARAEEAMRRVADAEWTAEKARLIDLGVPPAAIDLAAPVLNRPDDMVIDLSNSPLDEADVNVSTVVRGLLDSLKGTVDLSVEDGHMSHYSKEDGEDPDKAMLDAWDIQG